MNRVKVSIVDERAVMSNTYLKCCRFRCPQLRVLATLSRMSGTRSTIVTMFSLQHQKFLAPSRYISSLRTSGLIARRCRRFSGSRQRERQAQTQEWAGI